MSSHTPPTAPTSLQPAPLRPAVHLRVRSRTHRAGDAAPPRDYVPHSRRSWAISIAAHSLLLASLAWGSSQILVARHHVQQGQPVSLVMTASTATPEPTAQPQESELEPVEIEVTPPEILVETEVPVELSPELQIEQKEARPHVQLDLQPTASPSEKVATALVAQLPAFVPQRTETLAERPTSATAHRPSPQKPQTESAPPVRQPRRMAEPLEIADATAEPPPAPAMTAAVEESGARIDKPAESLPVNRAPDYPVQARLQRLEGRVVLLAQIDAAGLITSLGVEESSGHSLLDQAALAAVRRWRFAPARSGEVAVASQVLVPVSFSIRQR